MQRATFSKKSIRKKIKTTPIVIQNPPEIMPPIAHWSHSSLMAYLRNPLAWYKHYVEKVHDMPTGPAAVIGRAAHLALQHYYSGIPAEGAVDLGLEYLRNVPDFEINFGKARTRFAQKNKRLAMEQEYLQAIHFYLEKPPKHKIVAIEVRATAEVDDLPLPLVAVSDLVVESRVQKGALDIVDHKFVDSFSSMGKDKTLFVIQAIFNYYTIREKYGKPVRRFILYELKKRRNIDGRPQLRKYVIDFTEQTDAFRVFHQLVSEATAEISRKRTYLPNPSDMFEGENSFDIYRLGLVE